MLPQETTDLAQAAKEARALAMDMVKKAQSGHLGLPLGSAELGAVLFGRCLQIYQGDSKWMNRDRFILSAGHGSAFLYTWLHLAGFKITLEDLKQFRQQGSKTPGHPEYGLTDGVESTTGPLGQGVGNALGYAISQKRLQAYVGEDWLNYRVVVLAGDGCLQEGVALESISLAGRLALDNLILFYDSNSVTLDAMASKTQCDDVAKRFQACGWETKTLEDGHNLEAIEKAFKKARKRQNGQPKLIVLNTEIGRGIPQVVGTPKAHGESGMAFVSEAKKGLGLPNEDFFVSCETRGHFEKLAAKRERVYKKWLKTFKAWQATKPEVAALLKQSKSLREADLIEEVPHNDKAEATRVSGARALNALGAKWPCVLSGSADLHSSTKNYLKEGGDFSKSCLLGRNFYFGIREHAMGAVLNGLAYDGYWKGSGATFFTFSDYMRPAVRLAALSNLGVVYIWTHDSIGVGEDGPTHQPVEHLSALRAMPNLDLIRPADSEETAAAFAMAFAREKGPSGIVLSRQSVPNLNECSVQRRRNGTLKGGYILMKEQKQLRYVLMGTGSEVHLCLEAATKLGKAHTRVVSLPCFERFQCQDKAYQESVVPADKSLARFVAVEAASPLSWYRFVGEKGAIVGIDRFGASAPAPQIYESLGLTAAAVARVAESNIQGAVSCPL